MMYLMSDYNDNDTVTEFRDSFLVDDTPHSSQ